MDQTDAQDRGNVSHLDEKASRRSLSPEEKETELVKTVTAKPDNEINSLKATTTREDGTEYPTGPKLTLIVLALCLSVFLVALGMY